MSDFNGVVRWKDIDAHLRRRIEVAVTEIEKAEDQRAIGRAQGRLSAFREMLNIPETLSLYAAAAKEAEKNG